MSEPDERHNLCPDLIVGQTCFRVDVYESGISRPVFHEHVPVYRISEASANEVLRSLAARYSDWPGSFILRSHLNKRGNDPTCYPGFISHVSYPVSGVLRTTVSAPTANAWRDAIVSKAKFRS
jgi:hypothetical protein